MELKGISFILIKDFVEKALGPKALEKVLEKVSPETREVFQKPKKYVFYPWRAYVEFERALVDEAFSADPRAARKIGAMVAQRALKREYRLVFSRFRRPTDAVQKIQLLWNLYLRPGRIEAEKVKDTYWTVRLWDVDEPIPDVYAEHLAGWFEEVLKHFGAKKVRISWERKGEREILFHAMWES